MQFYGIRVSDRTTVINECSLIQRPKPMSDIQKAIYYGILALLLLKVIFGVCPKDSM